MNNLYNQSDVEGILNRIGKLSPDTERQWGKMTISQMLAHCSKVLETAMGKNTPKRMVIGRIFGPLVKPFVLNSRPMPKNLPTDKSYVVSEDQDFEREKTKAMKLIETFLKVDRRSAQISQISSSESSRPKNGLFCNGNIGITI